MSGLVALLSGDGAAPERGAAALSILHHDEGFTSVHLADDGVWLGACGRPYEISAASDPDRAPSADGGAGRTVAVVAGEVANAVALRRELGLPPQAAAAELALAAYRRWGAGLFERLEGIYALVVSEPARGATLAGTDAYGVMYLHVTRLGDDVLVATEAKAFLADPRFRPRLDSDSAACVVALGHEFGRGLFDSVEAAPQGCHFAIEGTTVRTVRHWDPYRAVGVAGGLRGEAYDELLAETVLELGAEAFAGGPCLLPLTGGLDSRLLAAARPPGADVRAFTFGEPGDPDCRRAGQIARVCGIPHQAVPFEPDYVARHALATTWLTEGRLTPAENTTGFQMPRSRRGPLRLGGVQRDRPALLEGADRVPRLEPDRPRRPGVRRLDDAALLPLGHAARGCRARVRRQGGSGARARDRGAHEAYPPDERDVRRRPPRPLLHRGAGPRLALFGPRSRQRVDDASGAVLHQALGRGRAGRRAGGAARRSCPRAPDPRPRPRGRERALGHDPAAAGADRPRAGGAAPRGSACAAPPPPAAARRPAPGTRR